MSRVHIGGRRSAELIDRRLWAYRIAGQVAAAYLEMHREGRPVNLASLADDVADNILDELEAQERRR